MTAPQPQTPTLQTLQASLAQIEANLARSRRQLAEAQQLSHIGSWEWDIASGEVWWSDELFRIYGMEPGAVTPSYEGFLERVHPDDRESVDARNRRAFADHQPFEDVKRIVRADGAEILMRTRGEVITDSAGNAVRMVGVCEDVTDRPQMPEPASQLREEIVGPLTEALEQLARGEISAAAIKVEETRRRASRLAQELPRATAAPPV